MARDDDGFYLRLPADLKARAMEEARTADGQSFNEWLKRLIMRELERRKEREE